MTYATPKRREMATLDDLAIKLSGKAAEALAFEHPPRSCMGFADTIEPLGSSAPGDSIDRALASLLPLLIGLGLGVIL